MEPPRKCFKIDRSLSSPSRSEDSCLYPSSGSSSASFISDVSLDDLDLEEYIRILPTREVKEDTNSEFEYSELDQDEFLEDPEDPLNNIPKDVLSLVFQHLTWDEIKAAMNVSRNWHNRLANCEEFMKRRFALNIEVERSRFDPSLLALFKSRRAYSNIQISMANNKEVEKVIDAILKKFAGSIVNLKIQKIGGYNSMLKKPLSFIKLESLELNVIGGRLSCPLDHICTLKKLSVNGLDPKELLLCLQQNPCLEELVLYENAFISYFNEDIASELPFKLRKLAIFDHLNTELVLDGEFPADEWDGIGRINFMKFLKAQGSDLKSLHMDLCFAEDLKRILKMLPALECLEVNRLTGDLSKLSLVTNFNVTTFIATKVSDQLLNVVCTSFRNLKSIFIENIKTQQFLYIIRNAHRLNQFCYFWASKTEKVNGSFVDLKNFYQRTENFEPSCSTIDIRVMKKSPYIEMIAK